jgi:hypothetical protein
MTSRPEAAIARGSPEGRPHPAAQPRGTRAALAAPGNVRLAMLPLGFRFDEDAVLLEGTAHRTDCPLLPVPLPRHAARLSDSEVLRAQCCPREFACAPLFETLLSLQLEPARGPTTWTIDVIGRASGPWR